MNRDTKIVTRNVIIGLLTVALIGSIFWAYQEREQKLALQINSENNYQRAFHDLAFHIDQIEDQLGSTLAMNTRRQLTPSLAEVWRVTSLAQDEFGQLPLSSIDNTQTEEFLYNLSKFSYRTSIRDLDKEPLTEEEYQKLENLYGLSKEIRKEIRHSQAQVLANGESWLDIEKEMNAKQTPESSGVLSNFEIMNKSVEGYSEIEWGPENASMRDINGQLKKALTGKKISKEEAKKIARDYLNIEEDIMINITEAGDSLQYPAYTLEIDDPDHQKNYYMDISIHGGKPIWFLQDRQIEERKISLNEASELGKKYLEKQNYKGMQLVDSKQYDSVGVLEFVYVDEDVRVYTDSIMLEVALDDGDILGYEAKDYIINHKERDIPNPSISIEEARKNINPRVEVMEEHVGLIKNELGKEVLCYEFLGVINDETYRIFINAEDGEEEFVQRLPQSESMHHYE
ncbi:germination protein YpeB [Alkalihalobacillus trypoxylicola]|uniref:germination protein YpeB n=1 Tax=Alkalihalobacillus trypoxylicola TaxID=519424 RepID=UPI000AD53BB3|nr:germination protein YpeB [Alkalihalobacillus trypoxylicola]